MRLSEGTKHKWVMGAVNSMLCFGERAARGEDSALSSIILSSFANTDFIKGSKDSMCTVCCAFVQTIIPDENARSYRGLGGRIVQFCTLKGISIRRTARTDLSVATVELFKSESERANASPVGVVPIKKLEVTLWSVDKLPSILTNKGSFSRSFFRSGRPTSVLGRFARAHFPQSHQIGFAGGEMCGCNGHAGWGRGEG